MVLDFVIVKMIFTSISDSVFISIDLIIVLKLIV